MFKFFVLPLFFCFTPTCWGQNLSDANVLFANFEYSQAAKVFEEKAGKEKLKKEDLEKLAYCYVQTGNFEKGLPIVQSLIASNNSNGNYLYWKGTLEKIKGDFELAISSYQKAQILDSNYNAGLLIESCRLIPTWNNIPRSEVTLMAQNDKMANNYSLFNNDFVFFYENGRDSARNDLNLASTSSTFTQLFLMKAYIGETGNLIPLLTNEILADYNITSISNKLNDGTFYMSVNNPIATDKLSHLLKATDGTNNSHSFDVLNFSKSLDTASYAHPSITSDGKTMIYSKMGMSTANSDLYISEFELGEWVNHRSLNNLNTSGNEMFPKIIGDSILTFSSDGRVGYGELDIYSIPFSELETEREPTHLKAPINSAFDDFNLSWTNDTSGYFVSNRVPGLGDDDVYSFLIRKETPIPNPKDIDFELWLSKWNNSKFYFKFDQSESELTDEFQKGFTQYSEKYNFEIELVGHADSQGSDKYNINLGNLRANWFKSKLTEIGVNATLIETTSVGESELVNDCGNNKHCSSDQQRMNRFVEIKITPLDEGQ
jgi:tetratricopeptide (TPR) repeat protein